MTDTARDWAPPQASTATWNVTWVTHVRVLQPTRAMHLTLAPAGRSSPAHEVFCERGDRLWRAIVSAVGGDSPELLGGIVLRRLLRGRAPILGPAPLVGPRPVLVVESTLARWGSRAFWDEAGQTLALAAGLADLGQLLATFDTVQLAHEGASTNAPGDLWSGAERVLPCLVGRPFVVIGAEGANALREVAGARCSHAEAGTFGWSATGLNCIAEVAHPASHKWRAQRSHQAATAAQAFAKAVLCSRTSASVAVDAAAVGAAAVRASQGVSDGWLRLAELGLVAMPATPGASWRCVEQNAIAASMCLRWTRQWVGHEGVVSGPAWQGRLGEHTFAGRCWDAVVDQIELHALQHRLVDPSAGPQWALEAPSC